MKKRSVLFIGILVLVVSYVSEAALSVMRENIDEQWSNYTFSWEKKKNKTPATRPAGKIIPVCTDKR